MPTPGTSNKFFTMDTEEELYEENKKLDTVLRKLDNFLGATSRITKYHAKKNDLGDQLIRLIVNFSMSFVEEHLDKRAGLWRLMDRIIRV
jgi:hypothetical protein